MPLCLASFSQNNLKLRDLGKQYQGLFQHSSLEIWWWTSVLPFLSSTIYMLHFCCHQPTCFVLFDLNNLFSGKRPPNDILLWQPSLSVLRCLIIQQLFNWSRADRLAKWRLHFSYTRSKFGLAKLWLGRRRLSFFWKKCKQVLSRAECNDSPSVSISQDSQSYVL